MKETLDALSVIPPCLCGEKLQLDSEIVGGFFEFFAEVFVVHEFRAEEIREGNARRPRSDESPEDPVGEAEDERERFRIAVVAVEVAVRDGVRHRGDPNGEDDERFSPGAAQHGVVVNRLWHAYAPRRTRGGRNAIVLKRGTKRERAAGVEGR